MSRKNKKLKVIEIECKFCHSLFETKNINQEFCSRRCMYNWRKSKSHETVTCKNCHEKFERYKNQIDPRNNKKQEYCSIICAQTSKEKRNKLSKRFSGKNNNFSNPNVIEKVIKTKMKRYGKLAINHNIEKTKETNIRKYAVPYAIQLSLGRVSKLQKQYYKKIKKQYSDALLEYYLNDVGINVDIYIPSKKQIIEVYGDFWHMNPLLFKETYENPVTKMTAKDKWKYDDKRIKRLKSAGYNVTIVWESDIK